MYYIGDYVLANTWSLKKCRSIIYLLTMFNIYFLIFQESNPALRLKDEVIAATLLSASGPSGSGASGPGGNHLESSAYGQDFVSEIVTESGQNNSISDSEVTLRSGSVDWQYFDEKSYIETKLVKEGEDAYAKNKFNQAASDRLASNRPIPDTRSGQCKAREWPSRNLEDRETRTQPALGRHSGGLALRTTERRARERCR